MQNVNTHSIRHRVRDKLATTSLLHLLRKQTNIFFRQKVTFQQHFKIKLWITVHTYLKEAITTLQDKIVDHCTHLPKRGDTWRLGFFQVI